MCESQRLFFLFLLSLAFFTWQTYEVKQVLHKFDVLRYAKALKYLAAFILMALEAFLFNSSY
jgi:hypothetical protein